MTMKALLARAAHQWPRKVAAVVLAFVMWLFVSTAETGTAQRSMLVPITTLGNTPDQVVVGLPPFAEVTVSGPTNRVDRLRAESFEAVIDLTGLSGDFQAPVVVTPPQGVALERVNPNEVLGILERVTTKQVPVQVVYLGTAPADVRLRSVPDPDVVTVRGRAPRLERVAQVIVAVDPTDGVDAVAPYAADAAGRPVDEVTIAPASITVTTAAEPVLVRREVDLALEVEDRPGLRSATLDQESVLVAGPPTVVAALMTLTARVEVPTEGEAGGRYTLPVTIATPSGVVVVSEVTATVEFAPAPADD
jgi:YbbR domain-containing protein